MYEYYHTGTGPTTAGSLIYVSTSRFFWSLPLAWVIFACACGYGGPVNVLLSWSVWAPLSKLTYCVYLIHPVVMMVYLLLRMNSIHYTEFNMVYLHVGHIVISFAAAFVISMAVEAPARGLEKIIIKK
ncbi:hypothetical protein ScPMuIL_007014 [Solemya velum]